MKFSIVKTKVFLFLGTVLFSVFLISSVSAQSGTTGVSGTVTDQNGAAVPGATVRIINPATNFNRDMVTDNDGKFNFPGIQPATYRLEIEAANFKKLVNTNVQALVEKPVDRVDPEGLEHPRPVVPRVRAVGHLRSRWSAARTPRSRAARRPGRRPRGAPGSSSPRRRARC